MSPYDPQIPYRKDLRQKARALRKASTLGEVLVWRAVKGRQLGFEFHRQVPIGEYIVDFFCPEKGLIVEIDGGSHDEDGKYEYDMRRQAWLEQKGMRVVRFTEKEVRVNLEGVIMELLQRLNGSTAKCE